MLLIALVGHVQKAFRPMEICERNGNCLRFLWVEDLIDELLKIQELCFKRAVFLSGAYRFCSTEHFLPRTLRSIMVCKAGTG